MIPPAERCPLAAHGIHFPACPNVVPLRPANVGSVPLDADLARRLAAAGRKTEEWRTRRDELVREAHRSGASLREIAVAVGLSNPGVLRIVRRAADPGDPV